MGEDSTKTHKYGQGADIAKEETYCPSLHIFVILIDQLTARLIQGGPEKKKRVAQKKEDNWPRKNDRVGPEKKIGQGSTEKGMW